MKIAIVSLTLGSVLAVIFVRLSRKQDDDKRRDVGGRWLLSIDGIRAFEKGRQHLASVSLQTENIASAALRRNWLPSFGGNSSSMPSPNAPLEEWPGDDSVPIDIAEHRIVKEVPKLPYRMYDHFDLGGALGKIAKMHVVSLKNDVAEVVIDPAHGGKILSYKVLGVEQLFRNPVFQPGMLGVLGAWTSGGIEFNWPVHGHSVFTVAPVFLATFQTREFGTVVRVFEFDRILNSTWQVDIALAGSKLLVHPRVVNTNAHEIDGYWWTNIGAKLTDSTRVLYSDAPYVLRNGGPNGDYLAPFPLLSDDKAASVAIEGNTSAFATDHSFPRNNYRATEMFLRPKAESANKTIWMASLEKEGSGFAHTQPSTVRGRKYWVWGQDPADLARMNFLSRCRVIDGQPSTQDCEGRYYEVQAGPAPTQNNFFPLQTEKSWTETFVPLDIKADTHEPGAVGYARALQIVENALASEATHLQTLEKALSGYEKLGPQALESWEVVHSGSGFGLVHEKLVGHVLNPSLSFDGAADLEAEPWLRLVTHGDFSREDLDVIAPSSFMVDWPYIDRLRKASESWLQQLHLGIALRQQGQVAAALAALSRSVALRPRLNPMGLVLLQRYEEAWQQASNLSINASLELLVDIAEAWTTSCLTSTGVQPCLVHALEEIGKRSIDSQCIRSARVAQLVYGDKLVIARSARCQDAIHLLLTTEWAVSDSSLTRLWRDAWYCIDGADTSTLRHQSRLAHPPPRFIDFNGAT